MLIKRVVARATVPMAAVALAVTACGGEGSPGADETPVGETATDEQPADEVTDAAADDATDEGDGDATDDDPAGADVDAGELFAAIAAATVDAGSYESEMTINAMGQNTTFTAAIELGSDISAVNMQAGLDMLGAETTVLIVDGQFYLEMNDAMGFPDLGASWVTVDPDSTDPFTQQIAGSISGIGSASNLLSDIATNPELVTVTEIGSDSIDGVATTQYLVTVDDVAAFQAVSEVEYRVETLEFTMWVDGDHLPRRMMTTEADASVDVLYTNYGIDINVTAPPADEVVNLLDLMGQ